jgi:hypothetical protein
LCESVLYAAKVEGTADAIERDFEHVHAVISTVEAHVSEVSSCGHTRARASANAPLPLPLPRSDRSFTNGAQR